MAGKKIIVKNIEQDSCPKSRLEKILFYLIQIMNFIFIITSILVNMAQTEQIIRDVQGLNITLFCLEYIILSYFTFELLLRFWACPGAPVT